MKTYTPKQASKNDRKDLYGLGTRSENLSYFFINNFSHEENDLLDTFGEDGQYIIKFNENYSNTILWKWNKNRWEEYNPKNTFTVLLTYFKDTGKYYSTGSYESEKNDLYEIFEEVLQMLKAGKRPGLIDGHDDFHVLINVPEHPHNHHKLIPHLP